MNAAGDSERAARVRQAFSEQAGYCDKLGSPFTALLCRVLSEGLDHSHDMEGYLLGWPGDPGPFADSVPLRVAGALHFLVRAGRAPELTALYPPHVRPEPGILLAVSRAVLEQQESFVREFLQHPPQTNEVGRSTALMAGWLEIAKTTRLPLSLLELGSSAGLNLIADRYTYRFGALQWAPHTPRRVSSKLSELAIACDWTGEPPAIEAPLQIRSRRGCDRNPLNTVDPAQRERLMAYVWADQTERLERLEASIRAMLEEPVTVEVADAADWVQVVLEEGGEPRVARVLFHSIVWSYLDPRSQQKIANHIASFGAAASTDSPFAWLRLELVSASDPAELRLTLWPGGHERLLARVHPHGRWVKWCS